MSRTPEHHRPLYGMGVSRAIDDGNLVFRLEREDKEGIVLEDLWWTDKPGEQSAGPRFQLVGATLVAKVWFALN